MPKPGRREPMLGDLGGTQAAFYAKERVTGFEFHIYAQLEYVPTSNGYLVVAGKEVCHQVREYWRRMEYPSAQDEAEQAQGVFDDAGILEEGPAKITCNVMPIVKKVFDASTCKSQ